MLFDLYRAATSLVVFWLRQKTKLAVILSLLVILTVTSACVYNSSRDGSYGARQVVLKMARLYIVQIVRGDRNAVSSMIFWGDYLDPSNGIDNRNVVLAKVDKAKGHWTQENSPFLQLEVLEVRVRDNYGRVVFRQKTSPDSPKISVKLKWLGNAWFVVGDSLFGNDGLLADL